MRMRSGCWGYSVFRVGVWFDQSKTEVQIPRFARDDSAGEPGAAERAGGVG
jgi:hypothetical protein